MADKFLLIDGSSLIHRAFFALPPLTNKKGVNTGAVYGFCNMLLKLLLDIQPQYVAVAFDRSRKTFRTIKYEQYKAQRKPTPSELSEQFPLTKELLTALGIKAFDVEDYEADDIIGTLASKSLERLNKEIRRRTNVVGIFPNPESYLRLVVAYLMEYAENWSVSRAYLSKQAIAQTLKMVA